MSRTTPFIPLATLLMFFFSLSLHGYSWAETVTFAEKPTLEVYETYHASHRVADVIDSLLLPGETIKVFGNKLIVRASNRTHEKILLVLKEIDRAPKNFLISIRSTDQFEAKKTYSSRQIRYLDDNTVIHVNNDQPADGVIVYKGSSRDGKISMSVAKKSNLTTRKENLVHQVRALEGEQAYITTGTDIPVTQLVWANGSVLPLTEFDRAITGFYVRPTLSKGEIILEISYQQEIRENKRQTNKRTSNVSTHLRIPLNEWAPLAGVATTNAGKQNAITLSTKSKQTGQQGVEIKVETIN